MKMGNAWRKNLNRLIIIVLSIEFIECTGETINFRALNFLNDMLPTHGQCYVSELENITLTECFLRSSMLACAGVFYNDNINSCKLLRQNCKQELLCDERAGWSFFSERAPYEEGWMQYKEHCYSLDVRRKNWWDAELQCSRYGAYLVEIESMEENEWIRKTVGSDLGFDQSLWTGGTDFVQDGINVFIWNKSGKQMNFSNWNDGEPNNEVEECLQFLLQQGTWNDQRCTVYLPFLCEKTF